MMKTSETGTPQATRCECRLGSWSERLLSSAHIPRRYEACTFSNFDADFDGAHRSLARARFLAGRFVEEYPVETPGLLFVGESGRGKTHLAVAVIRELMIQKRVPCLFRDYRELLKEIQDSYNPSVAATELSILRPIFDIEVLLLDELGAVKPTDWIWDTVSLILNSRYNDKKTTIITTNFEDIPAAASEAEDNSQLGRVKRVTREHTLGDRIGNRMLSRLHETCKIIKVEGIDFRERVLRNRTAIDTKPEGLKRRYEP